MWPVHSLTGFRFFFRIEKTTNAFSFNWFLGDSRFFFRWHVPAPRRFRVRSYSHSFNHRFFIKPVPDMYFVPSNQVSFFFLHCCRWTKSPQGVASTFSSSCTSSALQYSLRSHSASGVERSAIRWRSRLEIRVLHTAIAPAHRHKQSCPMTRRLSFHFPCISESVCNGIFDAFPLCLGCKLPRKHLAFGGERTTQDETVFFFFFFSVCGVRAGKAFWLSTLR